MRQSTKYLFGGMAILAAQTAFVAFLGWPQRMGYPSPAAIGIFLMAFLCVGYGIILRVLERPSITEPFVTSELQQVFSQHFGRKVPVAKVATETAIADFDIFKAFVIQSLLPERVLASLREQRTQQPQFGYCMIVFRRYSNALAEEIRLNDLIRHANADDDISVAIARLTAYGFEIKIAVYDEPSGRDLHIGIKQDEEAELMMRMMERLN